MNELHIQVEKSASQMRHYWRLLSERLVNRSLPQKCYERWENMARLHAALSGTVPLFRVRDRAMNVVKSLVDDRRIEEEAKRVRDGSQDPREPVPNFSHDHVPMDFSEARHLALTSYMTVTWSIYDRLANVCGRLAATDDIHGNPRKNPKLCEDLLARGKDRNSSEENRDGYGPQLFAFSMQHHLVSAYAWPAKVSYTLRNWFIHEGYETGSVQIFLSNRVEDGLYLNPDAVNHLEKVCAYSTDDNGNSAHCCITAGLDPWNEQKKNLLAIIEKYHEQIDTMFTGLVRWTVDSFVGQIDAFAQGDKTALTAAARMMPA